MNSEDHEMKAQCRTCGHGPWQLQKDDPADYQDGAPRCANPDCRSRDVVLIEQRPAEEEPVAARAFRRFREGGDGPLELVEAGLCDPDEARRLREEFNDLAEEYVLLTADELAERVEAARAEVREEAQERIQKVRQRAARRARTAAQEIERQEHEIQQLEKRLREEYAAGWEDCEEQRIPEIRKQVEEEYEEVEDRLAELAERAT